MAHRIAYYLKLVYLLARHRNPMGHRIGMMLRMEFRPHWLRP